MKNFKSVSFKFSNKSDSEFLFSSHKSNEDEIGLLIAPGVWANWSVPVEPRILKIIKFAP